MCEELYELTSKICIQELRGFSELRRNRECVLEV
jgi:hypothetical protein